MFGHSTHPSSAASTSQTSEPVNTSPHRALVTNKPEPMGNPRRSARLSAVRPEEVSTSRTSSSTSQAEQLSYHHFQEQKERLPKDRRLTKTSSQPGHSAVSRSSNRVNLPSQTSPIAYVPTSATKTSRSPKRVYTSNTGHVSVDMRQRRCDKRLANTAVTGAKRHVLQGQKGNNQVSNSKSQTKNPAHSADFNHDERPPAAQASVSAYKSHRATSPFHDFIDWKKFQDRVVADMEARKIAIAIGRDNVWQNRKNWNLNWSCSLMTHDTNV
ncbi:hypothetical protein BsWGS_03965 [Bradybaena similaris]